jgi:hypothetical protein
MAIAFVNVWDSKNGICTKELVNKVYHIGGKLIKLEYARQRKFGPQCQNCWSWTHGTSLSRINHQQCARCGQPHKTKNHDLFATCCGVVKKTADYTGVCAHPLKCINCKGAHLASNSKCVYKRHQNNIAWHNQRREANYKCGHYHVPRTSMVGCLHTTLDYQQGRRRGSWPSHPPLMELLHGSI